jgi:hypothetical protein
MSARDDGAATAPSALRADPLTSERALRRAKGGILEVPSTGPVWLAHVARPVPLASGLAFLQEHGVFCRLLRTSQHG